MCKDIFISNLTAVEIEAVLRWGFDKCVFFFEALQPFCDVRWIRTTFAVFLVCLYLNPNKWFDLGEQLNTN